VEERGEVGGGFVEEGREVVAVVMEIDGLVGLEGERQIGGGRGLEHYVGRVAELVAPCLRGDS